MRRAALDILASSILVFERVGRWPLGVRGTVEVRPIFGVEEQW
ncbi:hypothetical protein A20C1_04721 [marine actinobacterium PHSC20C1]|nr:hypothetical protein A20C1_04721 [marine actinobacterium PHSC20C1]